MDHFCISVLHLLRVNVHTFVDRKVKSKRVVGTFEQRVTGKSGSFSNVWCAGERVQSSVLMIWFHCVKCEGANTLGSK